MFCKHCKKELINQGNVFYHVHDGCRPCEPTPGNRTFAEPDRHLPAKLKQPTLKDLIEDDELEITQ